MYNNPYNYYQFNPQRSLDNINKQIEELTNMRNQLQSTPQPQPVNNIINTGQQPLNNSSMYEMRVLNDNEEAENIYASGNTIFIGNGKMQIKKNDGTIEKYNLEKYYPVDKKDERIKELEKQIRELKEAINNGKSGEFSEPVENVNKSVANDDEPVKSKSKTTSK